MRPATRLWLPLLLLAAVGCQGQVASRLGGGPVVTERRTGVSPDALERVAVIPFYPASSLAESPASSTSPRPAGAPSGGYRDPLNAQAPTALPDDSANGETHLSRWEIAALVSGFVTEALRAQGIDVVGPNDVELAFAADGHPVPRLDPAAAAQLAGRSFGARSVLLGRVLRYREREGGAAGATRPASVAFEASLHEVPTGRRLWTARFDETQKSLTSNVLRARQYPGGGTRWLSAGEFARWGAQELVRSLRQGQP
jgi:hypothetical protein